jgi:hypothetical protein
VGADPSVDRERVGLTPAFREGGVDTHNHRHVAVALDGLGQVLEGDLDQDRP